MKRAWKKLLLLAVALVASQVTGCALGYYWQAASGHLEIMRQRRPVAEIAADATAPPELRAQLQLASAALAFAHQELGLPDNGSYRAYADIGRDYAVWNVVAAPEFSLEPRRWCFPVAGCVSYRGYFDEERARRFAESRAAAGDDVFVGGVSAYSTLGRFEDPLLNTMMRLAPDRLGGLIFHELAHQRLYVTDDSTFNESFASATEQAGVFRWLSSSGRQAEWCDYARRLERRRQVRSLMNRTRSELAELYASGLAVPTLRVRKQAAFARLQAAYASLRAGWGGPPYLDAWFNGALNNARLAALATYDDYLPAFEALLAEAGGDLELFYARAAELGILPRAERDAALRDLLDAGISVPRRDDNCRDSGAQTQGPGTFAD